MAFKLPLLLSLMLMWLHTCQNPAPEAPEQRLPAYGSSYTDTKAWLEQHPYLKDGIIGPLPGMYGWSLIGWRRQAGDEFLDLNLYFDDASQGDLPGPLTGTELLLVKRRPAPDKDPEQSWDPRAWEDISFVNPWSQSDARGLELLRSVYGKALAEDFRQAKLIYDGPEYVQAAPQDYERSKIGPIEYRVYVWSERVQLYEGERGGYEINDMGTSAEKEPVIAFITDSRENVREWAEILRHNAQRYQDFLAHGIESRQEPDAE